MGYPVSARSFSLTLKSRDGFESTVDAGYRGRADPCQRERSDRALDRVTAVGTFHGDTTGSNRLPPFGLLAEAVPQQQRAGNRSGARSASRRRGVTTVKHRDTWSRQTAAAPPPTGTTAIRGKHSTVPCVLRPAFTAFLRFPGSSHRHASRCARA